MVEIPRFIKAQNRDAGKVDYNTILSLIAYFSQRGYAKLELRTRGSQEVGYRQRP